MNFSNIYKTIENWKLVPSKILISKDDFIMLTASDFIKQVYETFYFFEVMLRMYRVFNMYGIIEICGSKDWTRVKFIKDGSQQELHTNRDNLINVYMEAKRLNDKDTMNTISAYLLGSKCK